MNGLHRRIEALEVQFSPDGLEAFDIQQDGVEQMARRILGMADRFQSEPARLPTSQQSPVEQIIRTALAAAQGYAGDERSRLFWSTVAQGLRAYENGRAA